MIFLVILLILLTVYFLMKIKRPKNYPPGPLFIPIIGNLYKVKNLAKTLGGQHFALNHLSKMYKTDVLGLKFGNDLTVVVQSYPTIKEVLTERVYEGRPDNFFMKLRTMGSRRGITGTDGELWSEQRSFVVKHLKHLGLGKEIMSNHIKKEVTEVIKNLPTHGIIIRKLLAPGVINTFWDLTSGSGIVKDYQRVEKLIELLTMRSKAFDMAGGTLNVFPWLRFIVPEQCGYKLVVKINEELRTLFKEIIRDHYETWSEGKCDDLIYVYITEIKQGHETFSDEQLIMVLLDLFIAGSQTTSTTVDFAIMMTILRPDIQKKIHKYLDDEFKGDEVVDYSNRHKVPYVEAFLMEIMRYFLITPIIGPRRVLHDTKLANYFIPKDTTILLNLFPLYRDESIWIDPENFRPERFLDEDGSLIYDEHLVSFGLGRRRCLGEVLARNCLFTFFSEIVRKYDISLEPGSEIPSMKPVPGIVLSPQPYLARFTERNKC